jgi:hypothetical protein
MLDWSRASFNSFKVNSELYCLEYLFGLVEAAGLVIERDVANWIANQGGWVRIYILLFCQSKNFLQLKNW